MTRVDAAGSPVPSVPGQHGHHHKVRRHAHVPGQIPGAAAQVQAPVAPTAPAPAAAVAQAPSTPEMTKTTDGHVSVRA